MTMWLDWRPWLRSSGKLALTSSRQWRTVSIALNRLDQSYDPFVTTHTTRIDDMSFASFLGLLRAYESCLQQSLDFRSLRSFTTKKFQTGPSDSTTIICQICGKKGHFDIACFNRHNKQRFPTQHDKAQGRGRYMGLKSNNTATTNVAWYPNLDHLFKI